MTNDTYLNRLMNNGMHSYGMQTNNTMPLLPREAFLTECKVLTIKYIFSLKTNNTK